MFDRELHKTLEHLRIAFKNSVSLILFSHQVVCYIIQLPDTCSKSTKKLAINV